MRESYERVSDDCALVPMAKEEFSRLSIQKDKLFFVIMSTRPGVRLFATRLEYEYFPPLTESNKQFEMFIVHWQELPWFVLSVPSDKKDCVDAACVFSQMKVADGVPTIFGGDGLKMMGSVRTAVDGVPYSAFPLAGDNVFTIENVAGSPVYCGEDERRKLTEVEDKEIQKLYDSFAAREVKLN